MATNTLNASSASRMISHIVGFNSAVSRDLIVGGALLLTLLALSSCTTPPVLSPPAPVPPLAPSSVTTDHARYSPVPVNALPGWQKDELRGVWQAWLTNCGSARVRAQANMAALCDAARLLGTAQAVPSLDALRGFIEQHFQAWAVQSLDGKAEGLLTG